MLSSPNPIVKLGLTLTASSSTLDPSSSTPFYLIVTVRIVSTSRPNSPITLTTHLNALDDLGNRSFHNIVRTSPAKTEGTDGDEKKCIEIFPNGWPQYKWDPDNLRDSWDFVTVPAAADNDGVLTIKHQIDRRCIAEAGLEPGEEYQASFTDKCLGTRWWAFGSLEEFGSGRFRQWRSGGEETEEGVEDATEKGSTESTKFFMGEDPDELALVIENGIVRFTIC